MAAENAISFLGPGDEIVSIGQPLLGGFGRKADVFFLGLTEVHDVTGMKDHGAIGVLRAVPLVTLL